MGKFSNSIGQSHADFIRDQHMFFVATAPLLENGRINLSPKGYMDVVGSGSETSAHILENGRITFMFCSFSDTPNILRLYGKGRQVLPGTDEWKEYAPHFSIYTSTRQLIIADIDLVQTSCGFGIPLYGYVGEREHHFAFAEKKGEEGLRQYIQDKNLTSIDGLPTGFATEPSKEE
jgi:Pyridoxamine 5'-phosphate oxidase